MQLTWRLLSNATAIKWPISTFFGNGFVTLRLLVLAASTPMSVSAGNPTSESQPRHPPPPPKKKLDLTQMK